MLIYQYIYKRRRIVQVLLRLMKLRMGKQETMGQVDSDSGLPIRRSLSRRRKVIFLTLLTNSCSPIVRQLHPMENIVWCELQTGH